MTSNGPPEVPPYLAQDVELCGGPHDGIVVAYQGHLEIFVPTLRWLFGEIPHLEGPAIYRYRLTQAPDGKYQYAFYG